MKQLATLLIATLQNTDRPILSYIWRGALVTLVPSLLISGIALHFVPAVQRPTTASFRQPLWWEAFGILFVSPFGETLILWGMLALLRKLSATAKDVTLAAVAALIWAGLHSLAFAGWGITVAWPFFVFSVCFLAWKQKSLARAILVTSLVHLCQNILPFLAVAGSRFEQAQSRYETEHSYDTRGTTTQLQDVSMQEPRTSQNSGPHNLTYNGKDIDLGAEILKSPNIASVLDVARAELVWRLFGELNQIPRESGNEAAVRNHLLALAERHGLETQVDEAGNLVIRVPGRGTGVGKPAVILQGHMDMVCVADDGVKHNFASDPIRTRVVSRELRGKVREVLEAAGTTLGADNGIGLSMALAAGLSDEIKNSPPLEILCTVDEEVGLAGAIRLDPKLVSGTYLINLDNEDENEIYISSAGSRDMLLSFPLRREKPHRDSVALELKISGFPGLLA